MASSNMKFPKNICSKISETVRICFVVPLVVLLIGSPGCGGYSAAKHRVETTTARSTLEQVLASWKNGESPQSWQEKKPQVVIQDMDWKAGAVLNAFEILGKGEAVDANLYCKVKLKLQNPGQGEREQTVTYLVGTNPVLTVFRSLEP